ncbi:hypothetical protein GTP45_09080 [Pseudoduganella sp. FT55W]|uniref:Glucosamine/galactosamine-6-phosphate isomerase domain-containing protein n=1 Tax=Duganella rivi TaxID=2666083 RepID=A0A7X4GPR3_9BURK|nr:6-phosphogluconolactonase [Duganella rivi]MYM66979.1 hypothetical protein [Duganella rivi]
MSTAHHLSMLASLAPWFHVKPHALHVAGTLDVARLAAARLVTELAALLQQKQHVVLTPSVGRTMTPIFEVLRQDYRHTIEWQRVICFQMDEYAGMPSSDPASFAYSLRRDFIEPMGIARFEHFYDGDGACKATPREYEHKLRQLGGIDCALHGVGRNSHIGFNEPRQSVRLSSGVVRLSPATRAANRVDFQYGASLGLRVLREARSSIVVMLGEEKRDACYQLLFGGGGPQVPVSELRSCPQVSIFIDYAAVPCSLSDRDYQATPPARHAAPASLV